ncbi:hypothetical protein Tco_1032231 [Tanacetum coccineum]|uniref:Uncharacterized protein n=1 Tax=Tanacetum coccineum TaxID=301880 RepID=A0ABQ5GCQ7_9ASTR
MVPSYDDARNGNGEHNNSRMITTSELKISDEFLKILHDNAFNGMDGGDVTNTLQSGDAKTWWNNEINETTITWSELNDKFFHKYYPLSQTCNSKIPDDLDNGAIGDLDEYKEPCKKTCSDTFYKPYLVAQEAKDIYEVINREYSPIPILACHDIDNPDELCRTEEFTVVRHSIGNDEEFVTVGPSKVSTVERTPGSMSCIYHELFNRKDRGWTDLAETMIWYILKKRCVELIRAF